MIGLVVIMATSIVLLLGMNYIKMQKDYAAVLNEKKLAEIINYMYQSEPEAYLNTVRSKIVVIDYTGTVVYTNDAASVSHEIYYERVQVGEPLINEHTNAVINRKSDTKIEKNSIISYTVLKMNAYSFLEGNKYADYYIVLYGSKMDYETAIRKIILRSIYSLLIVGVFCVIFSYQIMKYFNEATIVKRIGNYVYPILEDTKKTLDTMTTHYDSLFKVKEEIDELINTLHKGD